MLTLEASNNEGNHVKRLVRETTSMFRFSKANIQISPSSTVRISITLKKQENKLGDRKREAGEEDELSFSAGDITDNGSLGTVSHNHFSKITKCHYTCNKIIFYHLDATPCQIDSIA